ncbi:hypothetical protein BAUCODRAFT_123095 [Baudoinia panamericana UAMH 10762]|uniref:Uncharacterized protein n=1 Tax=Baudoinia panamericana (strain UAMH 10762) TaxID=717646 RepID=M2MW78_BAUPA|nr:uncharacterized protein BAUCODRAFT_123095 [Baudoinia panamericana UAMH 10762]EMC95803.1 hypothetical protein BAUCODRAFT_123095 [Baudoinia panamericana UAMH 10762]
MRPCTADNDSALLHSPCPTGLSLHDLEFRTVWVIPAAWDVRHISRQSLIPPARALSLFGEIYSGVAALNHMLDGTPPQREVPGVETLCHCNYSLFKRLV